MYKEVELRRASCVSQPLSFALTYACFLNNHMIIFMHVKNYNKQYATLVYPKSQNKSKQ